MTMTRMFAILALILAAFAAPLSPAMAQSDIASAKAAGLVGERPDGLVGFVQDEVPAAVRSLVESVNAERRRQYAQVAQSTGRPLDEVQAVAGDRLVGQTPGGQFVMNAAGRWVKK